MKLYEKRGRGREREKQGDHELRDNQQLQAQ